MEWIELGKLVNIRKGTKLIEIDNKINSVRMIMIEDLRSDENIKYAIIDDKNILVNKEDLIIAWDGANAGLVGFNLEGAIGSTLARLQLKDKRIYPIYLGLHLQYKFQEIRDNCTGATIPHVNRTHLTKLKIPVPPIEIQKQIVEVLDEAQKLIDNRKEQIKLLDDLIQSIFYNMFGDPVDNNKKWEVKKLGELSDIVRGASPRPIGKYLGGNVPWIKIGDATKGSDIYLYDTKEKIIEEGKKKSRFLKKGSLIFANCGVSLGFARIITFDGCIHDGWLALRDIDGKLNKIFLLKTLNSYTDYFRAIAPDGTQPNLNTTIVKNFEIPIPPIQLQNQFAEKVELIEKQKELLQESLKLMEDNYNSLVQRAFKGELF